MIAIDTNILVRFVTQDDSDQARKVNNFLLVEEKVFIPSLVLAETIWVLCSRYHWTRSEVIITIEALLEIKHFIFEDEASVSHATWAYRSGGDWSDHFIHAQCKKHHCTSLATFDRKFAECYPDFINLLS